jgi:hypothetical protein
MSVKTAEFSFTLFHPVSSFTLPFQMFSKCPYVLTTIQSPVTSHHNSVFPRLELFCESQRNSEYYRLGDKSRCLHALTVCVRICCCIQRRTHFMYREFTVVYATNSPGCISPFPRSVPTNYFPPVQRSSVCWSACYLGFISSSSFSSSEWTARQLLKHNEICMRRLRVHYS